MEATLQDKLRHPVEGKPYCFVIMPFGSDAAVYEMIRSTVQEACALECYRADDFLMGSCYLQQKILELIRGADIVIAEVTESNPNVFYETGYATALGKPILLIAKERKKVPSDILGLERLIYDDAKRNELFLFQRDLSQHVRSMTMSRLTLLRSMLLPRDPVPSYIVSSLLPPSPRSWRPPMKRTYGDYIGVSGIITAFGALLGTDKAPELVSSRYMDSTVGNEDANLYLIGSLRANDLVSGFLSEVQCGLSPNWRFENEAPSDRAYHTILAGNLEGWPASDYDPEESRGVDYGIIVRGPHPRWPRRMVTIMAGSHTLGTGAACLAATRAERIVQIEEHLPPDVSLEDKDRNMWALIRGEADPGDGHLSIEGVRVVAAGVYGRP